MITNIMMTAKTPTTRVTEITIAWLLDATIHNGNNKTLLLDILHFASLVLRRGTVTYSRLTYSSSLITQRHFRVLYAVRRPCSDFMDMLRRLTNCRIIITAQCTLVQSAVLRLHVVRPSVCPSVTLVICYHINGKSWKLIARAISPTPSLFVAKRRSTYSQGNMGKFWGD